MIHIPKLGGTSQASDLKKIRKSSGGGDFAKALGETGEAEEASAAQSTSSTAAASPVGAMLGFQEVGYDESQNRQAYTQGSLTLDTLDRLQRNLLTGEVDPQQLRDLANMADRHRKVAAADPRLARILDEIELRALVELAKLERAQAMRR